MLYVWECPALRVDIIDKNRKCNGEEKRHDDDSEKDCLSDEVLFDDGSVVVWVLEGREREGEEWDGKLDTCIVYVGIPQVILCEA